MIQSKPHLPLSFFENLQNSVPRFAKRNGTRGPVQIQSQAQERAKGTAI